MRDGVVRRRVDVRHRTGGEAALDYDIAVRDDGDPVGRMRASLSPEAWFRLGAMLERSPWPLPSDEPAGDAATVQEAFVDVVVDMIAGGRGAHPEELRVGSTDTDLLERIAERSRPRLR